MMDMLHKQYQKEMGHLYSQYQQKRQALDVIEQACTVFRCAVLPTTYVFGLWYRTHLTLEAMHRNCGHISA